MRALREFQGNTQILSVFYFYKENIKKLNEHIFNSKKRQVSKQRHVDMFLGGKEYIHISMLWKPKESPTKLQS